MNMNANMHKMKMDATVFEKFNNMFSKVEEFYMEYVVKFVHDKKLVAIFYSAILVLTLVCFKTISTGFIPDEDQGVLLATITLPDGASLQRTEEVSRKFTDQIRDIDGINESKLTVFGGDGAVNQSTVIIQLDDYAYRKRIVRGRYTWKNYYINHDCTSAASVTRRMQCFSGRYIKKL